jgi:hypothetical protein
MTEPTRYRVVLPNGKKTKPYSKAKISAALEDGKLPPDSIVEVDGSSIGISRFCKGPTVTHDAVADVLMAPLPRARKKSKGGKTNTGESILHTSHPAMFRNRPVLFLVYLILIAAYGLGFILFLIWWLQCLCTTLIVTSSKTTLRKGILSKSLNEVRHKDVRSVQVYQSLAQRIFGVGKLSISSAGQSGIEIEVSGIGKPEKIKMLIDEHRD